MIFLCKLNFDVYLAVLLCLNSCAAKDQFEGQKKSSCKMSRAQLINNRSFLLLGS